MSIFFENIRAELVDFLLSMFGRRKINLANKKGIPSGSKLIAIFSFFIIILAIGGVIQVIINFLNYILLPPPLDSNFNFNGDSSEIYSKFLPLFIILIAPVVEELTFRNLLKVNRINLRLGLICFLLILLVSSRVGLWEMLEGNILNRITDKKISLSLASFLFVTSFFISDHKFDIFSNWWRKNIKVVIFLLSGLFALGHTPLSILLVNISWIISTTFFHFSFALALSHLRIKYGLTIVILFHFLWNGLVYLLKFVVG